MEFKSTGRKNVHTGQKDPAMEWGVVKTIAGSMNSHGDTLLVGVNDDGAVVGLQQDYPMLKKGDRDGWALWLTDMLSTCLAKVAASEIQLSFAELDGGDVARVDVGGAPQPVYAARSKGKKHQFLVRINNSTQELHGPEMLSYKDKRWPQ